MEETPITYYDYRGYHVPVYMDDPGQSFWAIIDGMEYDFGSYNADYEKDIEYIIDDKLDTIYRFDKPYWGASIKWFTNGAFRDIKLSYRSRTLKVFLTPNNYDLTEIEKNKIIKMSTSILERLINTSEIKEISFSAQL